MVSASVRAAPPACWVALLRKATQFAGGAARTIAEIRSAPDPGGPPYCGHRDLRFARPQACRPRGIFWQYRRFVSGEPARRVDWRRSARDGVLYVREQEWEASHTVWLWPDRSPSMVFRIRACQGIQARPHLVITFAIAEVLVHAGERVGVPGLLRPTGSRNVLEKFANAIIHDSTDRASLPPSFAPSGLSEIVVVSDFWAPISDVCKTLSQLSSTGAHGHVVQVVDPAEETFPYSGRVEFIEPEGGEFDHRRPRRSLEIRIRITGRQSSCGDPCRNRQTRLELCDPPHRPGRRRNSCWRCTRA